MSAAPLVSPPRGSHQSAKRAHLGEILISRGAITPEQLRLALEEQQHAPELIGQILIRLGYATEGAVLHALGEQLGLPVVVLSENTVDPEALSKVPSEFALRHELIPLKSDDHTLVVAMANPLDVHPLDDLRLVTGLEIVPSIASPGDIRRAIEQLYMEKMIQDMSVQDVDPNGDEGPDIADLQKMATEAVVIRLVNLIFNQAVQERASDIHVEPFEREVKVRYRVDGVLREAPSPPKQLHPAIVSRVKILADMNIAERRLPQDGRIRLRVSGRQIDVRVSTVPTLYGESLVMRILDKGTALLGLEQLGMSGDDLARFRRLILRPNGIILVTGPTGSGKSTSLYAALQEIYSGEKKIITVEDPVEYQLAGVNQIQVRPNIGLTFASGLRSIVRQDPDIIMVGEIRDVETVEISIHAALTGHLVFSTLHTNDAAGAMSRLLDMGAEPYLVASSLIGVAAQRLVRSICQKCKAPTTVKPELLREVGLTVEEAEGHVFKGKGCDECAGSGYKYRTGIYELMAIDDEVRRMVIERVSATQIKQYAMKQGMRTLMGDGRNKILHGLTTVDEVLRVAQRDEI
ncbi:MAG TPA: type II secretion system ATPase GspE [Armatimonadota bacterium]